MKSINLAKIAASSLAFASVLVGGGSVGGGVMSASAAAPSQNIGQAATQAKNAQKALAKGQADKAVKFAEAAVLLNSGHSGYRLLLGEAYLASGRFASAETSFSDALELSPGDSRAALKLALAKTALGQNDSSVALLEEHKDRLAPADFGLAMALAGNTDAAIRALETSVRDGTSDARTRQNLALAYALAGKWVQSRVLASQDLSPDLVDARMTQWATLARPKTSWDQVASLLGVKPVFDPGQPVQLALGRAPLVQQAAVQPPMRAPEPVVVATVDAEPAPVYEFGAASASAPPPPQVIAAAQPVERTYRMGPRREIVQPIPVQAAPMRVAAAKPAPVRVAAVVKPVQSRVAAAPLVRANSKAFKTEIAGAPRQTIVAPQSGKKIEAGQFIVQLGAFGSRSAADAAWAKFAPKAGFSSDKAMSAQVKAGGKMLHRLAASGFTSASEAKAACAKVTAAGGQCFVRSGGKDDSGIRWAFLRPVKPTRLASR